MTEQEWLDEQESDVLDEELGMASQRWLAQWEGHVLAGTFPLRKYRGRIDVSAVFLSEYEGQDVAIKLLVVEPTAADAQLREWEQTSKLSHPHLLSLLRWGSCQLGDITVAYTVSEWADENLAEVLRDRRLTRAEAADLLKPVLDVLGYLHRQGLVYGQLKASSVLAVRDQLKLSGDPVRRDGVGRGEDDVRQLGTLLLEALTQPGTEEIRAESLPEPFGEIVRRCLRSSQSVPTVAEIKTYLDRPSARQGRMHVWRFGVALVGIALVAVVFWNSRNPAKPSGQPVAVNTSVVPAQAPQGVSPKPTQEGPKAQSVAKRESRQPGVVQQFLPEIPAQAQRTIQGRVRFTVRVRADPSGNVRDAEIVPPATSRYFISFVLQAARKWKFEPSDKDHTWILRFDLFSRDVKVSASIVN